MPNLLILGSTGALGSAILEKYRAEKWDVTCAVRKVVNDCDIQLPLTSDALGSKKFDAVVFAQGANVNGSAMQTGTKELNELFEANVTVIAESVSTLMGANAINEGGRVVILSSLWEQFTRQEKFAYSVTKAAVGGLVRSMAVDLGNAKGILVNGLLPGVVDSPMARGLLKPEQIENVEWQTPGHKMVVPSDVANAAYLLGCEDNTAISGQSLFVDYGFAIARVL